MSKKTIATQKKVTYSGLSEAIESFLQSRTRYQSRIKLAEVYANILATEYFVCCGIGFTKYLN